MRNQFPALAALLCILFLMIAGCAQPEPADLVLRNGKIVTVDDKKPEAEAVAIRGGSDCRGRFER